MKLSSDDWLPSQQYHALHGAYLSWLERIPAQIIVHGNFRMGRSYRHDDGDGFKPLTLEVAQNAIEKSFMKRASRRIFGTKRIDLGERLLFGGMIEGDAQPDFTGRPRYHAHFGIAGIPDEQSTTELCKEYKEYWESMHWGYGNSLVEPCFGDQWRRYALKHFNPNLTERFVTNVPFEPVS